MSSELFVPRDVKCPPSVWEDIQQQLVKLLVSTHEQRDLFLNYDIYMEECLKIVVSNYHGRRVREDGLLETFEIVDAYYVRPFNNQGFCQPLESTLYGSYKAQVCGTVIITLASQQPPEQVAPAPEPGDDDPMDAEDEDDEDDEDDEAEEQPHKRAKTSASAVPDEELVLVNSDEVDLDDDDDDEQDDEEAEEEEEEEEEQDDMDDQQEEAPSERDDVIDDLHELDDLNIQDDDIEEEQDNLDDGEGEAEDGKEDMHQASVEQDKPFAFTPPDEFYSVASKYPYVIRQWVERDRHLFDMPVMLGTSLCFLHTPFIDPISFYHAFLRGGAFSVGKNFKLLTMEEPYICNRPLFRERDKLQIRSKYGKPLHVTKPIKQYRTNATINFYFHQPAIKSVPGAYNIPQIFIEIPFERPKAQVPAIVLIMAYGLGLKDARALVYHYLEILDSNQLLERVNIRQTIGLILDQMETDAIQSIGSTHNMNQRAALLRMAHAYVKGRAYETDAQKLSFISFTLHDEFLSNLIDYQTRDLDVENTRKRMAIAEAAATLIWMSSYVNTAIEKDEHIKHLSGKLQDGRSYAIKVLKTPGEMIILLVRNLLRVASRKALKALKLADIRTNSRLPMDKIIKPASIPIVKAIQNGNFEVKADSTSDANRNKTIQMVLGHRNTAPVQFTKVNKTAITKNPKVEPTITEPTMYGRICRWYTPESDKCGAQRYLSVACMVSPPVDLWLQMQAILMIIQLNTLFLGWIPVTSDMRSWPSLLTYTEVKDVFGGIIGWTRYPVRFYKLLRQARRQHVVYKYLSISWDQTFNFIYLNADENRMLRPVIPMESLDALCTTLQDPKFNALVDPVSYLVQQGLIEYIDSVEEFCGLVLVAESYEMAVKCQFEQTYLDISSIITLCRPVCISHLNLDQGPRRMYTANMRNRDISLKLVPDIGTKVSHTLMYGQRPLVSNLMDDALDESQNEPAGLMVSMAIYSEYNEEDSGKVKRQAIERGVAMAFQIQHYTITLEQNIIFGKPGPTCTLMAALEKYWTLQSNGFPQIGQRVPPGDAIVGKQYIKRVQGQSEPVCIDMTVFNNTLNIYVVEHIHFDNPANPKTVRVSVSTFVNVDVGNKFHLGHGQKFTVGTIADTEDMLWDPVTGITPDIEFSTFSLKRITKGVEADMLLGKAIAMSPSLMSKYQYNTILSKGQYKEREHAIRHVMAKHNMLYTGQVMMQLGTTGQQVKCAVFEGPVYLHVLPHRAPAKARCREMGKINSITRQSTKGATKQGAQQFGNMEMQNIESLGMSAFLQGVNYTCADAFVYYWCTQCHCKTTGPEALYICLSCKSSKNVVRREIPYIGNIVPQELSAMGLGIRPLSESEIVQQ